MQKGANISNRKNVLGRGLSALMSASAVAVDLRPKTQAQKNNTAAENTKNIEIKLEKTNELREGELGFLGIKEVVPGKLQPRQNFVESEINSLADSIKNTGLLQPLIVRKRSAAASTEAQYEIVAGERRWRAATLAGLEIVPVLLKNLNDKESLELGIIENVQRADLNPLEEALAYKRLIDGFGASQSEIAETVGKDRASIANALRLLKLSEDVQKLLVQGKISAGHARTLLAIENSSEQLGFAKLIIEKGLSVRATEDLVNQRKSENISSANKNTKAISPAINRDVLQLEERLRRVLGTKVRIQLQGKDKGEVRIAFYSNSELESILDKLKA